MKTESSKAVSFDFIGGKDVMPIGGFFGPYPKKVTEDGHELPDYISDEYFQLIAESGINLITASATDYLYTPDMVHKYLELGEKYGIGVFVNDGNLVGEDNLDTVTVEKAEKQLKNYQHYPAYCGMHIVDEPTSEYYLRGSGKRNISRFQKVAHILQNELGQICYINMFPVVLFDENKENYVKYVNEVCETLRPNVLMWDYYPFTTPRDIKMEWYLWNMDLVRQASKKYQKPFWSFIQAGGQWNDAREHFASAPYYPNESEFNWNINTSLAFGAQGIQYFPVLQPYYFAYAEGSEWDVERNGIVGALGNKTRWYYYAQKVNRHIAAIDEVLMNAVNEGIIVNGDLTRQETVYVSCIIESGKFEQLQSVSGDTMVGCFYYNEKTALYVVNYSQEYAQDITLEFDEEHQVKKIQNAVEMQIRCKDLVLNMEAGEGVLLVID